MDVCISFLFFIECDQNVSVLHNRVLIIFTIAFSCQNPLRYLLPPGQDSREGPWVSSPRAAAHCRFPEFAVARGQLGQGFPRGLPVRMETIPY